MKLTSSDVCVISGASSGIGKQIAKYISKHFKSKIILLARTENLLKKVENECLQLGASYTLTILCDVTKEEQVKNAIDLVITNCNEINYLFLCAGISGSIPFIEMNDLSIFTKMFETNVMGYVYLTKYVLPHFKNNVTKNVTKNTQKNGKSLQNQIIVISSVSGIIPIPLRTAYCMSKFGVEGFFRTLKTELKADEETQHVKILMIEPAWVDTEIRNHHVTEFQKDYNKKKMMSVEECVNGIFEALLAGKEVQRFQWIYKMAPILYECFPRLVEYITLKKTNFKQVLKDAKELRISKL
ncbi:hypothetical protein ABK040_003780 [Willaertia magna]